MKKLSSLLILLSLFVFVTVGDVADIRLKVYIHVEFKDFQGDSHLKTTVESYLKRELRALPDVDLVREEDAYVILGVMGAEYSGDIAIAFCDYRSFSGVSAFSEASHRVAERYKGHYTQPRLSLAAFHRVEDLDNVCKRIIADFDQKNLEPLRHNFAEVRERMSRDNR